MRGQLPPLSTTSSEPSDDHEEESNGGLLSCGLSSSTVDGESARGSRGLSKRSQTVGTSRLVPYVRNLPGAVWNLARRSDM